MDQNRKRTMKKDSKPKQINKLNIRKYYGITMEIPLFLTMLGISLSGATLNNVVLYRTCIHTLGHSDEDCNAFLGTHQTNKTKHLEEEVQQYATFVNSVKMVMESVVPAILSLFLGVWSDKYGRKPLVIWPLLGMSISMTMVVIYSMLNNLGPWWYLLTAVPFSLSGGFGAIFTGAYCYVSDITTPENRSIRMTMLEATVSVGVIFGSLASSYLLGAVGHVYLLLIVSMIFMIAYGYTQFCITESLAGAVQGGIKTVLDVSLVKEMVRECFKERLNYGRARILLLIFANTISTFVFFGLMNLEYMYTRNQLQWAMREFTVYSAINTSISFIGNMLGVGLVQNLLRMSDLAFAAVALLSSTVEYLIKTFAVETWHMYFGASISIFKGLSSPLIRSLLTKMLPPADIGKVFSLMGVLERMCPLLSPIVYNSLYALTVSTFPMSIYILSSGFTLVSIGMLGFVQYYSWKVHEYVRIVEKNE